MGQELSSGAQLRTAVKVILDKQCIFYLGMSVHFVPVYFQIVIVGAAGSLVVRALD